MNWMEALSNSIKNALKRDGSCRIAVHSEAQAELGQRAAQRLGGENARYLTFELIPEKEQDIYPIGTILVS